MGITISPLRLDCWPSRGREPADSPESIVTIVARVNLGCAFLSPWLAWLLPRTSTSWLGSLLSSIVQARRSLWRTLPFFGIQGAVMADTDRASVVHF